MHFAIFQAEEYTCLRQKGNIYQIDCGAAMQLFFYALLCQFAVLSLYLC